MEINLPQRISPLDIDKAIAILGPKVVGIPILDARKIDAGVFDDKTVTAIIFLGLIENQDGKVKLNSVGRDYYKANNDVDKKNILQERIRQIPVYDRTIEYFYHNNNFVPTKVDVAAFWHDNFSNELGDIGEDELTNAAIFFVRFLEFAGLGKYVQAGIGRDTHAKLDQVKVAEYITSAVATPETIKKYQDEITKEVVAKEEEVLRVSEEINLNIQHATGGALSGSNIRAIQKLQLELTEKDLDSPGAKKLLLDMLDRSEKENTVLKAKVETYKEVEKQAAILGAKVKSLSKLNLLKTSVNSIGGIILGLSLSLSGAIQQYIVGGLGGILIIISIFLREDQDALDGG